MCCLFKAVSSHFHPLCWKPVALWDKKHNPVVPRRKNNAWTKTFFFLLSLSKPNPPSRTHLRDPAEQRAGVIVVFCLFKMPHSLGTLILGRITGEKLTCKGGGPSLMWCRMDKAKKSHESPIPVLFYGAGRGTGSLRVPAKESSAAEGISLLFHIPQIHFWSWRHKGSLLGALSKPCGCHWELVPAMGLGWV